MSDEFAINAEPTLPNTHFVPKLEDIEHDRGEAPVGYGYADNGQIVEFGIND